jgi:hypothetical protein
VTRKVVGVFVRFCAPFHPQEYVLSSTKFVSSDVQPTYQEGKKEIYIYPSFGLPVFTKPNLLPCCFNVSRLNYLYSP